MTALAAPTRATPDIIGLEACDRLLAAHLSSVEAAFGPSALGVIDLPALSPGSVAGAEVRVAAVLYWAHEIEQAGLLPFVEGLAQAVVAGTFLMPLGAAIHPLVAFGRRRDQHFTRAERQALFDRMFGGAFETAFGSLAESLALVGRAPADQGITHLTVRAAAAARQVGELTSASAVGIAAFAARDIVQQTRAALALLGHRDLVRALGGGTVWTILARHAPLVLRRSVDPMRHLTRARAGATLLEWVAQQATGLDQGRVRLVRQSPVVAAAEAWLSSSGSP